jgi:hypothetical protein
VARRLRNVSSRLDADELDELLDELLDVLLVLDAEFVVVALWADCAAVISGVYP